MEFIQVSISILEFIAGVIALTIAYTLLKAFKRVEDLSIGFIGLGFLTLGVSGFITGVLILASPMVWPQLDFYEGLKSLCGMMGGMMHYPLRPIESLDITHSFVYVYSVLSLILTFSYFLVALGYTLGVWEKSSSKTESLQLFPLLAFGEAFSIALLAYIVVIVALGFKEKKPGKTLFTVLAFTLVLFSHLLRLIGFISLSPEVILVGEAVRPVGFILLLALVVGG